MSRESLLATYLVETPHEVEATVARVLEGQGEVAAIRPLAASDLAPLLGADPAPAWRRNRAEVDVSIPLAAAEPGLPNLATALLGNGFELPQVCGLRLLDFELPADAEAAFAGPAFGIEGTRRLAGVEGRPLIGTIVKPSVGLTPAETAARVSELARAGIDFIKDDELLASPPVSPLEQRVEAVMNAVHAVAEESGRKTMFAFNISSDDYDRMRRNHDAVLAAGGTCVMVSLNQVGLGAFASLRRHCALPVHGHRNGWGMLTRTPNLGLDFRAYQRLWRLAGIDQLHCNGFANKFFESDESVARSVEACLSTVGVQRPLLPVLSSGQWGGQAPATYRRTRTLDLLYLAGGGIQGHPGGASAGVAAVRAAWEAAVAGEPLEEKAREHPALAAALVAFGGRRGDG
jgi:ribulose 1,5-bisphosphate carboxylase large subunit-like protein